MVPALNVIFNVYNRKEIESILYEGGYPVTVYPNGAKDESTANFLLGLNDNVEINRHRYFTNVFKYGFFNNRFKFYSVDELVSMRPPFPYIYPIHIFNTNFYQHYSTNLLHIPERVVADIKSNQAKLLFISDEGGEVYNNVFTMLENVCSHYKILPKSIFFISCNYLIESILNKYNGIYYNPWQFSVPRMLEVGPEVEVIKNNILKKKLKDKKILCFNRNNHKHRAYLVERMLELGIEKESIITYLNIGANNSYWKELIHLNTKKPLIYDIEGEASVAPININLNAHLNSYINVVTETLYEADTKNTVFFSEKTFKPILCFQPFILVGQAGGLEYLRKMGYKTFEPYINEAYDNIIDPIERLETILEQIQKLNNMSFKQLTDMTWELYPVLLHNFTNHIGLIKKHHDGCEIINKIIENW